MINESEIEIRLKRLVLTDPTVASAHKASGGQWTHEALVLLVLALAEDKAKLADLSMDLMHRLGPEPIVMSGEDPIDDLE
jgi:hypothetical protein